MQEPCKNQQDSNTEPPFLSEVAYKEHDQNVRILVSNIFNYVADIIWSVLEYIDTKSQEELRYIFEDSDSEKEQLSDVEISPLNIEETMKSLEFDTNTPNLYLTGINSPKEIIITDGADTINMSITGRGRSNSMLPVIGKDSASNELTPIGGSGINQCHPRDLDTTQFTDSIAEDQEHKEWVTDLLGE